MSEENQQTIYPKGAEWRKWDLHIHSDASDGHMSCEQIVKTAVACDLSVIALTDHHTAKNIDLIRHLGDEAGLSVLSGIEFRTEYGSRSVHLIGLFPERYKDYELDSSNLQSLVLDSLNLSEARIIAQGKKRLKQDGKSKVSDNEAFKVGLFCVQVNFKEASKKIHEHGGVVIPHAGSKENSLEREMRHEGKAGVALFESLGPVKQELFDEKHIDICEIAKRFDNEEFYLEKFNRASIACSDAHETAEIGRNYTWIKADPTFEGLQQVMKEPASRVFIGDRPELLQRLELNPTKFFKHLVIEPEDDYDGKSGKWFDNVHIELNPELIAIIGNKGSGKSAIADILGLCTNCRRENRFSFLNPRRFRKKGYADVFRARLAWISGDAHEPKNLMTNVDLTRPESAKYLPQGYFEELCNEIDSLEQLKIEINEVVFQHVPEDLKLEQHTFKDFLEHRSKAIGRAITNAKRQLNQQNRIIVELEKKRNPKYRLTIRNALSQKEEELKTLKAPKTVRNPLRTKALKEQKDSVQGQIEETEKAISALQRRIDKARTERRRYNSQIENLSQFKREIEQYDKELRQFIAEKRKLFKDIAEIQLDQIVTFEFKTGVIDASIAKEKESMKTLDVLLSKSSILDKEGREQSLVVQLTLLEKPLQRLYTKLDQPNKAYQNYLKAREAWAAEKAKIIGDRKTPGTLAYLKERIRYLGSKLDADLKKAREKREHIVREIYHHKQEIIAIYSNIKEHISRTLQDHTERIEDYPINIVAEFFIHADFLDRLLGHINKTVSGNYKGVEEAQSFLAAILGQHNVNDQCDLIDMLSSIIESLESETRQGESVTRYIDDQIDDMEGFYNYLFGLDYLAENYQLKLGNKSLETLSPGEKGALLLVFYLLLDKSNIPLILDQPEDNLDNQSVYQILVPFIKEAKKRRQIVMITHNPNLAVVGDAEQIVRVDIRKDKLNEFMWISGSIENPLVKKAIVDVLEGTMPAFQNRSNKYAQ